MSGLAQDTVYRQNAMTKRLQEESLQDRIDYISWSIDQDRKELRELKRRKRIYDIARNDEKAVEALAQERAEEILYGYKDNGK